MSDTITYDNFAHMIGAIKAHEKTEEPSTATWFVSAAVAEFIAFRMYAKKYNSRHPWRKISTKKLSRQQKATALLELHRFVGDGVDVVAE